MKIQQHSVQIRHVGLIACILGFHAVLFGLVLKKHGFMPSTPPAKHGDNDSADDPPRNLGFRARDSSRPRREASGHHSADISDATKNHSEAHSEQHSLVGHGHAFHAPEIIYIFFTLVIAGLARYGLKLTRHVFVVPYTVVVLVLGCFYALFALAEKKRNVSTTFPMGNYISIALADPNVLIMTFLPGLIYEAAFHMQTHLFKKLLLHMIIIGSIGLILNITLVGIMSREIISSNRTDWDLNISLWYSAIVSATDPVAVIALLEDAGTAKTLMVVLEGTSLLSDTSAVVLSNLMEQIITSKTDPAKEVENFFAAVLGGPAWGLLIGMSVTHLLSRMNSVWEAELILIVAVPYLTFWSADAGFSVQLSGALATMTLGLWMSAHRTSISPDVEQLVNKVWALISLISNTLIFSIVGIIIVRSATEQPVLPSDWFDLFILNLVILLVRGFVYTLLKPVLSHFGIGDKVFTWPHIFVLIWSGFRGAVSLALALKAAQNKYFLDKPRTAQLLIFHTSGAVAFTLLFNAITMRFFLRRLGILEIPLAKLITMHMAMKQILLARHQKFDGLKTDRYLADADWQKVEDLTKIDGNHYGITDDGDTELWTMHFVTREVGCPSCDAEVQLEPLPSELEEMESIARIRLINAKKTSYWRQYEEGTLSQNGIKHLDDLTEMALNSDKGVIDASDIQRVLGDEKWSHLREWISTWTHRLEARQSVTLEAPRGRWRRWCFRIATSPIFFGIINAIIVLNLGEAIAGWIISSQPRNETVGPDKTIHLTFLLTNAVFTSFYTMEAAIIGLGWLVYWGNSWFSWHRFDFALLILSFVELTTDIIVLFDEGSKVQSHAVSTSAIRVFRFLRLIRIGRALRLLRPVIPSILKFMDRRINAHLFLAYDVAKAFIISQEESLMMISNLVGYKPLATVFKSKADTDCRVIVKEIGLLGEKRPDVAAAVKTRQAIRSILNHLKKSVEHMRSQGILDEDEVEHLQMTIEERLKRLHHFSHSIPLVKPMERLWNVSWINGSQEVFDVLRLLFEERVYPAGTQFMSTNEDANGVYIIVSGVVSITYPRTYTDNAELGEIYNSDNLRIGLEEGQEGWHRHDYILAGGLLNEQSTALDFPRRSSATADTPVQALFFPTEFLFRAMSAIPSLEAKFWKKTAASVALNILIKLGNLKATQTFRYPDCFLNLFEMARAALSSTATYNSWDYKDSTLETEKSRLSRGAVRLIHPDTRVLGLDEFEEIFIITGILMDTTNSHGDLIIGPKKISSTCREVEVRQGRHSISSKEGELIYPEYAVFLLVPPNGRDLSGINLHDSQADLLERPQTNPSNLRNMLHVTLALKNGSPPTEAQLLQITKNVAVSGNRQRRRSTVASVDTSVFMGTGEKRGSNAAAMLSYARSRKSEKARVVYNVLGETAENEATTLRNSQTTDQVHAAQAGPAANQETFINGSHPHPQKAASHVNQNENRLSAPTKPHQDWWGH